MSFNQKMMDTKLRGIQVGVDDIGNKLFAQNEQLGSDLKMFAYEIGMCRAALYKELAQQHLTQQGSEPTEILRLANDVRYAIDYMGKENAVGLADKLIAKLLPC